MTMLVLVCRTVLGLVLLFFGLNGFFHFMEPPGDPPAEAAAFLGALEATGYMWPLANGTQVFCGLLLVLGRFVPLALTVLAPFTVHILAFHIFLEPAGTVMALGVLALQLVCVFAYRRQFTELLTAATPPFSK